MGEKEREGGKMGGRKKGKREGERKWGGGEAGSWASGGSLT